jgi:hypothetical protein
MGVARKLRVMRERGRSCQGDILNQKSPRLDCVSANTHAKLTR